MECLALQPESFTRQNISQNTNQSVWKLSSFPFRKKEGVSSASSFFSLLLILKKKKESERSQRAREGKDFKVTEISAKDRYVFVQI